MTMMKTPGRGIILRNPGQEPVSLNPHGFGKPEGGNTPAVGDMAKKGIPGSITDPLWLTGIDDRFGKFNELWILYDFLADHVRPDSISNVQCMLLWNEWVRMFWRRTHEFPGLFRERRFRRVIADKYGTGIIRDRFRGDVFTGIRFVP